MIIERLSGTDSEQYLRKAFSTPSFDEARVISGTYDFNSFSDCLSSLIAKRSTIEEKRTGWRGMRAYLWAR